MNPKNYLLTLYATLAGEKAVLGGLGRLQGATKGYGTVSAKAGKQTETLEQSISRLAKRAILTIPLWLALRSVFTGVIRTIGDMVRANVEFEEKMARVRTVVSASSKNIEGDMLLIKRSILDVATTSRASLGDLTDAFYFLRTANLSTEEAMAGFLPTVDAMVGTMNNAKDTARAVAGIYNTMKNNLDDNLTTHEKFRQIADALTYTYATQDVQLDELIQSYTKIAPYLSGLNDSFNDIITTLGFLNTRMLRAGRTGRLTGRAILQLTKNADKLRDIFGITFDPDEPISFLRTIEEISKQFQNQEKLTARQSQALQEVFATRGGVAVRLLVQNFDELNEELRLADENMAGFAERMREIREATITAQVARLKNNIAVLGNEFVTGAYSSGDMVDALELLNDTLSTLRPTVRAIGDIFGYISYNLSQAVLAVEAFANSTTELQLTDLINPLNIFNRILEDFSRRYDAMELDFESPTSYFERIIQNENKLLKIREDQERQREIQRKSEEELREIQVTTQKQEEEALKHNLNLLQKMGVHQLDIARYHVQYLEQLYGETEQEDEILELQKAKNRLLEEQVSYRREIVQTFQDAELEMAKVLGATESQILDIKEKQLETNRAIIGEEQYMIELTQLRTEQQLALQREKQKELEIATDLYLQYQKADEFERARLRRLMELRLLSPQELAKAYEENAYDRGIIEEYWSRFSEQGRIAVGEVIQEMYDLPDEMPDMPDILGFTEEELLPQDKIADYWREWEAQGKNAVDIFSLYFVESLKRNKLFPQGMEEVPPAYPEAGTTYIEDGKVKNDPNLLGRPFAGGNVSSNIENVNVYLPEDSLSRVAEETANQIETRLKSDETLARAIAKMIRPYV